MKRVIPKNWVLFLATNLYLIIVSFVSGEVRTVPGQYPTIQSAIDASSDGDEVIVSPGTYVENINFKGKNIIVRSTEPTSPTIVASTIINGNHAGSVVTVPGTETTTGVLSGFTITNGYSNYGAGIDCPLGARITIENNVITSNTAYGSSLMGLGGGIIGCGGIIRNNIIIGNYAENAGGGIQSCFCIIRNNIITENVAKNSGGGLDSCGGMIQNNLIRNNTTNGYGGGLSGCNGTIQDNLIIGNSAAYFGGGLCWCQGGIQNNTIYGNSALGGGGMYECRGLIVNCILWGNTAILGSQVYECSVPLWSCIQNWVGGGRGNISGDPLFVNPADGDFHLNGGSPCIDSGNTFYLFEDNIVDMDKECRLAGASVDMGADEFGSSLDSDGDLLADWQESLIGSNPVVSDTDGDGLCDGVEFLRGTNPNLYNLPVGISIPADYPAIQQGLFMAFPQETITVTPGIYYENLHLLEKTLILQSTNPLDEEVINNTIIDGENFASVIFAGSESEACIQGLTIRKGTSGFGGGICGFTKVFKPTKATVKHNKIIDNTAIWEGGGLAYCNGVISNNFISNNTTNGYGGGLSSCSEGTISENIISHNIAASGGGLYHSVLATIVNNIISYNQASSGGGGMQDIWDCDVIFNTIYGNSALIGGGINVVHIIHSGAIRNNIVWANTASSYPQIDPGAAFSTTYCCIQDWALGGVGNISSNPQLVDPENGDFHLKPTSPCIDAGGMVSGGYFQDFEGDLRPINGSPEPRGDGSDYDIGADEYYVSPSPTPTPTPIPPATAKIWQIYE